VIVKRIQKLWTRIVVAIVIGFLVAAIGTSIPYTCTPTDSGAGCISFDKAVMHPGDLLSNEQSSLVKFSTTFVVTSLATLALISVLRSAQKKRI